MDEVRSWQHRPLEGIYAIVYFDALVVKVRQDIMVPKNWTAKIVKLDIIS